jgi:hypothetical protein
VKVAQNPRVDDEGNTLMIDISPRASEVCWITFLKLCLFLFAEMSDQLRVPSAVASSGFT